MKLLLNSCSILLFLFVIGSCKTQKPTNYYQPVFDQTNKVYVKTPSPRGVALDTTVMIRSNLRKDVVLITDTIKIENEFELTHGELIVPLELIDEKPPTYDTILVANAYSFQTKFINSIFPIIPEQVKSVIDSVNALQNPQNTNFAAETFDTSATISQPIKYDTDKIAKRYSTLPLYLDKSVILADTTRDLYQADSLLTDLLSQAPWKIGDSIPIYNQTSNYCLDSLLYLKFDTVFVEVFDQSKVVPQLSFNKLSKEVGEKMVFNDEFIIDDSVSFWVFYPNEEDVYIQMVRVEGGDFKMGNNEFDEDERPATRLSVSRFLLSKFEVTNKLFCYFLNDIECDSLGESEGLKIIDLEHPTTKIKRNRFTGKFSTIDGYDDFPVVNVSWAGCQLYCKTANGRLPSEAEWEYAAKGGVYAIKYYTDQKKSDYDYEYRFAGGNFMGDLGWFVDNSRGECRIGGRMKPNALGIYDMCGNVWEWCYDKYTKDAYNRNGDSHDPMNLTGSANLRVNRGGSWSSDAQYCRICNRNYLNQYEFNPYLGFRYMREWK